MELVEWKLNYVIWYWVIILQLLLNHTRTIQILSEKICRKKWHITSQGSVVSILIRQPVLWYRVGGRRFFSSLKCPEQLWGPFNFLCSGYQVLFSGSKVELAAHLSLVVRLKMNAYIPFLPLMCLHIRDRNNFTFHNVHINSLSFWYHAWQL